MNIVYRIRDLRSRLNFTQKEITPLLGIMRCTFNRWENGHSDPLPFNCITIYNLASPPAEDATHGNGRMPAYLDAGPHFPVDGEVFYPRESELATNTG
ncbi:MAG: hypothetical protein O2794_01000 [bacterium]|nr:hypothetical protein [bacterium]